jgi:hypothetical protein
VVVTEDLTPDEEPPDEELAAVDDDAVLGAVTVASAAYREAEV